MGIKKMPNLALFSLWTVSDNIATRSTSTGRMHCMLFCSAPCQPAALPLVECFSVFFEMIADFFLIEGIVDMLLILLNNDTAYNDIIIFNWIDVYVTVTRVTVIALISIDFTPTILTTSVSTPTTAAMNWAPYRGRRQIEPVSVSSPAAANTTRPVPTANDACRSTTTVHGVELPRWMLTNVDVIRFNMNIADSCKVSKK